MFSSEKEDKNRPYQTTTIHYELDCLINLDDLILQLQACRGSGMTNVELKTESITGVPSVIILTGNDDSYQD